MIFFNEEKFIEEAIKSILAQTYENWELLLVDDGSTDCSTKIAHKYIEKYPKKVRYLAHENHQNKGMSATRNLGIRNAQGEYIAFLDADDVWLSNNLEQYVNIFNVQPEVDMIYGNTQKWYSWTGNPEDLKRDQLYDLGINTEILVNPPVLFDLLIQEKISAPCTCSLIVKREVLQKMGGFAEYFRGMYEDQAFYAKIFLKSPIFISKIQGAKYRKHPDSCVSVTRNAGQTNGARFLFLQWLVQYLLEQQVTDVSVWESLHKALWPYRHPGLNFFMKTCRFLINKINKTIIFLKKSGSFAKKLNS